MQLMKYLEFKDQLHIMKLVKFYGLSCKTKAHVTYSSRRTTSAVKVASAGAIVSAPSGPILLHLIKCVSLLVRQSRNGTCGVL
jgi:hypothetical protein